MWFSYFFTVVFASTFFQFVSFWRFAFPADFGAKMVPKICARNPLKQRGFLQIQTGSTGDRMFQKNKSKNPKYRILRFRFWFPKIVIFQKSRFNFADHKITKTVFLLSDNDYFLRLIFQNQDFGYYPKKSEFCSKYEHKFYARNPEITSDFDGQMPTEKNAPEKQYHKIDFADYQNFGSYSCN